MHNPAGKESLSLNARGHGPIATSSALDSPLLAKSLIACVFLVNKKMAAPNMIVIKWQGLVLLLIVLLSCFPSGTRGDTDNDNLLQNYGFTGTSGNVPQYWTLTGAGGIVPGTVDGIAGSQPMGLRSTDPNNPSIFLQHASTTRNTEYSVTFWAYHNTSTATGSSTARNLSLSFGSHSWSVDASSSWTNYSFTTEITDDSTNIQWSSYDASGAYFMIGWPCFFLADGSDDDDSASSTTAPNSIPTILGAAGSSKKSVKSTTVIAGAVGGAVVGLLLLAILVGFLLWRRKKSQKVGKQAAAIKNKDISPTETEEGKAPEPFITTPWVPEPTMSTRWASDQASAAPWAVPLAQEEQPLLAASAIGATSHVNSDQGTSAHTNNNSNAIPTSENNSIIPSVTEASSSVVRSPTYVSMLPSYQPLSRGATTAGPTSTPWAIPLPNEQQTNTETAATANANQNHNPSMHTSDNSNPNLQSGNVSTRPLSDAASSVTRTLTLFSNPPDYQPSSPSMTSGSRPLSQATSTPWAIPLLPNRQSMTPETSNLNPPSRAGSVASPFSYAASSVTRAPTYISNPPDYRASTPNSIMSGSRSLSTGALLYDDEVGRWAASNRDHISPDLEQKLREAHYRPADDPKEITDKIWNDRYGVGHFELKRIQELYDSRHRMADVKVRDATSSSQGGTSVAGS